MTSPDIADIENPDEDEYATVEHSILEQKTLT
jgi:hypothetical protein